LKLNEKDKKNREKEKENDEERLKLEWKEELRPCLGQRMLSL
jgi:hypothetical protein